MNISVAHFRHLRRLRKTGATLQKNIRPRALFSYVVITKWKGLDRNIIPFHPRTLQLTMETIHYAKVVRVRRLFRCNNLTLWGSGRAILLLENEDYFIRPRLLDLNNRHWNYCYWCTKYLLNGWLSLLQSTRLFLVIAAISMDVSVGFSVRCGIARKFRRASAWEKDLQAYTVNGSKNNIYQDRHMYRTFSDACNKKRFMCIGQ